MLAGFHRNGDPLWARLIKRRDLPSVEPLAKAYALSLPDPAALAAHLDWPTHSSIGEHLARTARAQLDLFAACLDAIGGFLSPAPRQQLQALRQGQ